LKSEFAFPAFAEYRNYILSLIRSTYVENPMPPHITQQFLDTIHMSRSEEEWIDLIGGLHAELSYHFRVMHANKIKSNKPITREGYPDEWYKSMRGLK